MIHQVILSKELFEALKDLSEYRIECISADNLIILSDCGFAKLGIGWQITHLGKSYLKETSFPIEPSSDTLYYPGVSARTYRQMK